MRRAKIGRAGLDAGFKSRPVFALARKGLTVERMKLDRLTLFFDPSERQAAELIAGACTQSVRLILESWGLDVPDDCRIYVMTSWLHFMFHAAPWPWRIWMGLTLPLWAGRARKMWPVAGGFHQPYGRRRAIGVKPPRLMVQTEHMIGERLFVPAENQDLERKARHAACHELVHACTAHLGLPMWLNEGLAMLTVDRFAGEPTVRQDTLQTLARAPSSSAPMSYQRLRVEDRDAVLYHAARGYWLTRYLAEVHPDVLRQLLVRHLDRPAIQRLVAQGIGLDPETFWEAIDRVLIENWS